MLSEKGVVRRSDKYKNALVAGTSSICSVWTSGSPSVIDWSLAHGQDFAEACSLTADDDVESLQKPLATKLVERPIHGDGNKVLVVSLFGPVRGSRLLAGVYTYGMTRRVDSKLTRRVDC